MKNKFRGTCQITLGEKQRGLVFNMNTYAIFCEGMDIDLEEIETVFQGRKQAKAFAWLLYSACFAYDEKHSVSIDYSIHDFYDWVMDITQEDTDVVMQTMTGSRELGNDSNNGLNRGVVDSTKEESKKK